MRFTVGGESYEITPEQVVRALKGVEPEPIVKHLVEIEGSVYPPKQVFGRVTGRDRMSFTTYEAQRVLSRLGFVCRRAGHTDDGTPAWIATRAGESATLDDRVSALEASLATMQAAVAGLHGRVVVLEGT